MSLVVLQRHGLLGELLPTVARYLDKHPDGAVAQLVRQGLANTDQRVAAGKPVTPDLPVRVAALRSVRGDHREAAAGEVARHRHHRRLRGPRGARRAGAHHASRNASRWVCARCSPRSRDWNSRAAGVHCACSSSRASARASTCCCCAPRSAWRRKTSPSGGRACRKYRRPIATAWPTRLAFSRDRRVTGSGPGAVRAAVVDADEDGLPRLHERRGRRFVAVVSALAAGLRRRGQQSRRIPRAGRARIRRARALAAHPAASARRRCIARRLSATSCSRRS